MLIWDEKGIIREIIPTNAINKIEENYQLDITEENNALILPGFVDCHCHYPQISSIAEPEIELLSWLKNNIWPNEKRLIDIKLAQKRAELFLNYIISGGTTTAAIFGSQYREATEILFELAKQKGLFIISGMTLQDRNSIRELEKPLNQIERETIELIEKWHKRERSRYAITPRFAIATTEKLLKLCGEFLKSEPSLYLQTHLNENPEEIKTVKKLFPTAQNYLEVYHNYHLVNEKSLFAHSIHTTEKELELLAKNNASVVHCPSSNLFLGSGLFPYTKHLNKKIKIGIGTDIGAGLSPSPLFEMKYAFIVQMALPEKNRIQITPEQILKAATIDGAKCLGLDSIIGNFEPNKYADFCVLEPPSNSEIAILFENLTPKQMLQKIVLLEDKKSIKSTYIKGKLVYSRKS